MKAPTRIQQEKTEKILDAALDVFSSNGFRGATLDQIADAAGLSKPNLLYYFPSKEAIHGTLIDRLLENWLAPLHALDNEGDPIDEAGLTALLREAVAFNKAKAAQKRAAKK